MAFPTVKIKGSFAPYDFFMVFDLINILLISSTKRVIHFLAKDELMVGMKRIIFKNMGLIPVNRRIHDKKIMPGSSFD